MSNRQPKLSIFHSVLFTTLVALGAGCAGEMEGDPSEESAAEMEIETRSAAVTATTPLYLRRIEIYEDGETVGDPEIYVICKTITDRWSARKYLENVDETDKAYTLSVKVMDVKNNEWPVTCEVWEGDDLATGQDFIGYSVFVQGEVAGTSATTCTAGTDYGDAHLGVSKVRADQIVILGVTVNVPCGGWR